MINQLKHTKRNLTKTMQYTGQVVWFSLLTENQREIIESALNLAVTKGAYSKSEELEANTMVEALRRVKELHS